MPAARWGSLAATVAAASLVLGPMVVRADPAATVVHVVQPGETLSQIADDAGVDASALATLNAIDDPNVLAVGQSLSMPARGAPAQATTPARAAAPAQAVAPTPRSHTVADGETLWGIAQQLGTTTDALAQFNHLDNTDRLAIGQVLAVEGLATPASPPPNPPAVAAAPAPAAPKPAATPAAAGAGQPNVLVPYTVQAGETLTRIAQQFSVRPDAIVQASGLDDPNKLSIGSVLKVPLPAREHVVSAGETLRDIAAAEKVDLGSLIDFNQIDDPQLIRVGQVVRLPVAASPNPAPSAAPPATPPAPAASPAAPAPAPAADTQAAASARPAAAMPSAPAPTKPALPVAPPRGAPTDGLAGAGLKLLGAPYVWGGSSPSGFDCSGFIWYVARQVGKSISRGMLGEYNSGAHPSRDELKPGDLVFFQNTYHSGLSHNGIYIGNGQFVHAADESAGVTISSLGTPYWTSHWFGATRPS